MEENINKMSKNLASFCNNLQSTTNAFKQSLERRPIPLDSASTTFIQSLNRRSGSLTADLNLLESMSFATVSFEELLGHCYQLYQHNHSQLVGLRSRLHTLGYISSCEGVDDLEEDFMAQSNSSPEHELHSFDGSIMKNLENDPLFEDPPSLQNLGLSDICLATLASKGGDKCAVLDTPPKLRTSEVQHQDGPSIQNRVAEEDGCDRELCETVKLILVSDDDYGSLPSYMKSLAPWKDLESAVEKMNSFLSKKEYSAQGNFFHPDELESMGLGPKGRSYLLLLVRMNRLSVETSNGLITYRVL